MFLICLCFLASITAPIRLWLMTTVGPPLCAINMFPVSFVFFAMTYLFLVGLKCGTDLPRSLRPCKSDRKGLEGGYIKTEVRLETGPLRTRPAGDLALTNPTGLRVTTKAPCGLARRCRSSQATRSAETNRSHEGAKASGTSAFRSILAPCDLVFHHSLMNLGSRGASPRGTLH